MPYGGSRKAAVGGPLVYSGSAQLINIRSGKCLTGRIRWKIYSRRCSLRCCHRYQKANLNPVSRFRQGGSHYFLAAHHASPGHKYLKLVNCAAPTGPRVRCRWRSRAHARFTAVCEFALEVVHQYRRVKRLRTLRHPDFRSNAIGMVGRP
jgi:hypothetical protein